MFLRRYRRTKNGKTHTYWRLVRAVRVGRKVRQQIVAQLGELDAQGRIAARHLADSLIGVSMTRSHPNFSSSPSEALNAPP